MSAISITEYPVHEVANLFPVHTPEEDYDLMMDIKHNGQKVPCLVWHGQLIDGRGRVRACKQLGIEPIYEDRSDVPDPMTFVVSLNYVRRSLMDSQKDAIAAEMATWDTFTPLAKIMQYQQAVERQAVAKVLSDNGKSGVEIAERLGVSTATISNDLNNPKEPTPPVIGKTVEQAAVMMGRNRSSVSKAVAIQKSAPDLMAGMKNGSITTGDAYRNRNVSETVRRDALVKVESGKSKTITDAVREVERDKNIQASLQQASVVSDTSRRYRLWTGSVIDALDEVEPDSLDAIITDPPYPNRHIDTWDDLAVFAAYALKHGGILLAMSGQANLSEVFRRLDHDDLTYRWTLAYQFQTGWADNRHRQFHNYWKPILVYHKGLTQPDMASLPHEIDLIKDGNQMSMHSGQTRDDVGTHHHWGQRVEGFVELVRRFTVPGDLVCDPFIGSGTTLLATLSVGEGRKFAGGDIDPLAVETTKGRLAEWLKQGWGG